MGLFDMGGGGMGGLDMEALIKMLNPVSSAEAAPAAVTGPTFDDRFNSARPGQGAPFQAGPGVAPAPIPQDEAVVPETLAAPSPPAITPPAPTPLPPIVATGAPTLDDLAVEEAVRPGGVGAALTGGTTGPTETGPTDISAQSRTEPRRPNLAEALKGTAMPKQPELQKIGSPAAPRPTGTIKSGELMALLTALNSGGGGKVLGR